MRSRQPALSASLLLLAALVGCNLHSGSGLDPDEILEGGATGNDGDGGTSGSGSGGQSGSSSGNLPASDAEATGSSSGGNSGGGSGSSSGSEGPDAGPPPPVDASSGNPGQCPANPSTCVDCCGQFDPAGYQAFLNAIAPCLCGDGNGDVCSAQCANEVCVDNPYSPEGDACEVCVNKNGSRGSVCFAQARQACQNAGTCTTFMGCYGGCPSGGQ